MKYFNSLSSEGYGVKAHHNFHAKVLEKIGVDRVIDPEKYGYKSSRKYCLKFNG